MSDIDERMQRLKADEPRIIRSTGLAPGRTVLGDMPPIRPRRATTTREREHGRIRPVRYARERTRRKASAQEGAGPSFMRDQLSKVVICAGIALAALLFKAVDTPATNAITDGLYTAVNADVKLDGDIGRLKFVQDIFPQAAELVFWQSPAPAPTSIGAPCDGEVSVPYDKEQGMLAYSCISDAVVASADGQVKRVDRDSNGFLRVTLSHNGGLETVYGHLGTVMVKDGERVPAGARIALMSLESDVPVLHFAAVQDGTHIDPTLLVGQ